MVAFCRGAAEISQCQHCCLLHCLGKILLLLSSCPQAPVLQEHLQFPSCVSSVEVNIGLCMPSAPHGFHQYGFHAFCSTRFSAFWAEETQWFGKVGREAICSFPCLGSVCKSYKQCHWTWYRISAWRCRGIHGCIKVFSETVVLRDFWIC